MKSGQRQKISLVVVALLGVGIVLFWAYDQHIRAPEVQSLRVDGQGVSSPQLLEERASGSAQDDEAAMGDVAAHVTEGEMVSLKSSVWAVQDCFPQIKAEQVEKAWVHKDLQQLLKAISPQDDFFRHNSYQNFHLQKDDGQVLRVQLLDDVDASGRPQRELKVFAVDREGLPIPIEIGIQQSLNPSQKIIDQYLQQGRQIYFEDAYVLSSKNDELEIGITEVNQKIIRFDYQGSDAMLECSLERGCHCEQNR